MLVVYTVSNSVYEIDREHHRIRRLGGTTQATPRMGDNEWKEYDRLVPDPIEQGRSLVIMWGKPTPLFEGSPTNIQSMTTTSVVMSFTEELLSS